MLLGGFNARVRILKLAEEQWQGVLGKHGLEERNAAGEDFWQYYEPTVNHKYQKKTIHFGSWMRGISLLDAVGNVFAGVIQEHLQVVAEKVLPESPCGFFVARQLLEKAREHQDSLFTLFVDLRKSYNSVPREALWQVPERCSVAPRMLKVVKSCRYASSGQSESFRVTQL